MDLLRLLEIDRSLIGPEAGKSLLLAERVWSEEGCPRDSRGLVIVLEKILRRCVAYGIWYAPVFLQRKKALDRGTWRPAKPAARSLRGETAHLSRGATADASRGAAPAAANAAAPPCEKCGGAGVLNAPSGLSCMLCPCGAYMRRYVKTA